MDEGTILKRYGLTDLQPERWEDVESEESAHLLAQSSMRPGETTNLNDLDDPLSLRGHLTRVIDLADPKARVTLLPSSKGFEPKAFLAMVHGETSLDDLVYGVDRLNASLRQRSEALKLLVEDNFDRFVGAKSAIDSVYKEMKAKSLNKEKDFIVGDLKEVMLKASSRADQVFVPVLENRSKADKLRSTVNILEQSKFFFNLPGSLLDHLAEKRYEAALRDYSRGQSLYRAALSNEGSARTKTQRKRVFQKVWEAVEMIMEDIKEALYADLRDTSRGPEHAEQTIGLLYEFDTTEDPLTTYFSSQGQHIKESLEATVEQAALEVTTALNKFAASTLSADRQVTDLGSLLGVSARQLEYNTPKVVNCLASNLWQTMADYVKACSSDFMSSLPEYWRLGKLALDGRLSKKSSGKNRNFSQIRDRTSELAMIFISRLSQYFDADDSEEVEGTETLVHLILPIYSNSVVTGAFCAKLLYDVQDSVNDLRSLNISQEVNVAAEALFKKAQHRCVTLLCEAWISDAKIFHNLEDWRLNEEDGEKTVYLRRFNEFNIFNARAVFKLSSMSMKDSKKGVDQTCAQIAQSAFLDSLYGFLDGLVPLAFSDHVPKARSKSEGQGSTKALDLQQTDIRILITISNLSHLRTVLVPKMVEQFREAFKTNLDDDLKTLEVVVGQLDNMLFDDFIKRKTLHVSAIIRKGILESGIDWYEIAKPRQIHSFIYESLLYLVSVHAQVSTVAKPVVNRTISTLLENIAQDSLECFRQVEKFGMGGMLQATLEIEFLHQALAAFVTPQAESMLKLIYETISQAYKRKEATENLQSELDNVKKLLVQARRATALQFLAFKNPKKPAPRS